MIRRILEAIDEKQLHPSRDLEPASAASVLTAGSTDEVEAILTAYGWHVDEVFHEEHQDPDTTYVTEVWRNESPYSGEVEIRVTWDVGPEADGYDPVDEALYVKQVKKVPGFDDTVLEELTNPTELQLNDMAFYGNE